LKEAAQNRDHDMIKFRNGYAKNAPEMLVEFRGIRKRHREYEILLGRILKIERWKR
jgi:hypothetical protein